MATLTFRIGDIRDTLNGQIERFKAREANYYEKHGQRMVRNEKRFLGFVIVPAKTLEQAITELKSDWETKYCTGRYWYILASRLTEAPDDAIVEMSDEDADGLGILNAARQ